MSPFEHRLSLLSLSQNPTTHWEVSKANIHPRKKYTFQTSEMAPKRKQTTKSSGTVTGTISTKPADKEEQAKARALKRAERVEAKRAEAEKRKEAVRPLLCHLCHQPQSGGHRLGRATRQRRLTVTFQGNAHFRAGEFHEAIQEYESAIEIHGPSVLCLSNLAAAWLKLEE